MFPRLIIASLIAFTLSYTDKVFADSTLSKQDVVRKGEAGTISNRTRIRKVPGGKAYRFLEPGESITVLEESGEWLKVKSQWQIPSVGKPLIGYILRNATSLPKLKLVVTENDDKKLIMNQLAEIERLHKEIASRDKQQQEQAVELANLKTSVASCQRFANAH